MQAIERPAGVPTPATTVESPVVRRLGLRDYVPVWQAMQAFTSARGPATRDEIWLVEHPPVYTVGLAGRAEHLPRTHTAVQVVKIDRGGQITYHGPGQSIVYLLLDLRRRGLGIRELVQRMEAAVLDLLAHRGVAASRRAGAPGVYVDGAKIAALGLRVRHGCCYHGVALNVDVDLAPFQAIDPCGYPGLAVTRTRDLGIAADGDELGSELVSGLIGQLARPLRPQPQTGT